MGSVLVFTQLLPHFVVSAEHVAVQLPLSHTCPAAHIMVQLPQWLASLEVLTHAPEHVARPAAQVSIEEVPADGQAAKNSNAMEPVRHLAMAEAIGK